MFLIDSILLAPLNGVLWVAQQLHDAVGQEQERREEELKARLRELYLGLEAGQLDEQEFQAREAELLDQLDALMARPESDAGGTDDGV